jgi:hypothetical protein
VESNDPVTPDDDYFCKDGCILMREHSECLVPDELREDFPELFEQIERLVIVYGTNRIEQILRVLEDEAINEF